MADNPRIEDLRRRVQKDPASIAFAQLAEEYRRAGRHQEAMDACVTGLAIHPAYLSARVTLGRALIELGDLDRAHGELETVLKNASENLAAIRGMADIHFKRGAFAEALEFYRRALVLAPNDPDLDQTVTDLTHRAGTGKRPEPKDGLSFDQIQQEMAARLPPTPAPADLSAAAPRPPALRISSSDAAGGIPNVSPASRVSEGHGVQSVPAVQVAVPAVPSSVVRASDSGDPRASRTIAALDQWLDAIDSIHVTRAHPAS